MLNTYRTKHASLEIAALETGQQKGRGVTGSGSGSASQEGDGVETHCDGMGTRRRIKSVGWREGARSVLEVESTTGE